MDSGEPSAAMGAPVAVIVTGSTHTGVRRNVTVRVVGPRTATSRANGANPTWRTMTVYSPGGRPASPKPPSAPVVATRCSSEMRTVAAGTGAPSESVTRPERVSRDVGPTHSSAKAPRKCMAVTISAGDSGGKTRT